MNIEIVLTEQDLKKLVREHLSEVLNVPLADNDINIKVKSKQNYKAEWEEAAFKATVSKSQ